MTIALALAAAYLVGSIDLAGIVARMSGVRPGEATSPQPGKRPSRFAEALTVVGDAMKGVVGAAMGLVASGVADPRVHWAFAAGLAAVVGHCYPVFHRFRSGGTGLAPTAGMLLFTVPLVGLLAVLAWTVSSAVGRPVVGTLAATVAIVPLAAWQQVTGLALVWLALCAAVVAWRTVYRAKAMSRQGEDRVSA